MKKHFLQKTDSQDRIFEQQQDEYRGLSEENQIGKFTPHKASPGFRDGFSTNGMIEVGNQRQIVAGLGRGLTIGNNKPISQNSMSSFSSTNNNSKIAAGPLSGNEVSQKGGAHVPIYLSHDDEECEDQSETDDEEERLDCVHDFHGDGEEADFEEADGDEDDDKEYGNDETHLDDRLIINDSSMDGDIEDADGQDTERRNQKRPSLFNKLTGIEQQRSVDSDHFKKKPIGGSKQFPLNQMRRRQSGQIGQGLNQIQINISGDRPANLTNSFQETDKQVRSQLSGNKGLFGSGQHKIKLNSSTNHQHGAGFSRLNSEQTVILGQGGVEAAMRNSHYQAENSAYTWSQGMAQQPANPPRSRQETDFRRKTLQNFNTRSNQALGSSGVGQRNIQGDKMILPLRGENLEHSPYQKEPGQSFAINQPYQANSHLNQYGNKFSKSSTRKSSNNLNLQQMSFQGVVGSVQNSKRVRESHSQSQSPSMLGVGHNNVNPTAYKNNSGGNTTAIRQFMKGNLKNQQQTNSGYPAANNSYTGPGGPHKNNLNRLAFTANNFYDSRNMLGGVPYGMRQTTEANGPQNNSGVNNNGQQPQAMSRQSRSRQKIIKTNTYGVIQQTPNHSPGQIQQQNSFVNAMQPPSNVNAMQQSPYDNALPMVEDFYGQQSSNIARNTFYVSDDQRQKSNLFKELISNKLQPSQMGGGRGAPNSNHYFAGAIGANQNGGGANSGSRQVQRVIWNGPGGHQASSNQHLMNQGGFTKPRALSRQADAHIKIEVHRDIKIRNYLQGKQAEGMNLMFYDFNGSSFGQANNNTAQNFYKPVEHIQGQEPAGPTQEIGFRNNYRAEGDRVPTRERGYRSANQNMRRRDLHKKNIKDLQDRGAVGAMTSVNETVAEHPKELEQDLIPQGL